VTRENLFKISMACAREEDLDAPFSSPVSLSLERRRTGSETSLGSSGNGSDLPSISEEEEEEEIEESVADVARLMKGVAVNIPGRGQM
jgi:hypothetical protein